MSGTSSVPNTFASQVGLVPASQLDANWSAITAYINLREVSSGTLAARPVTPTAGQWYLATAGGSTTLFFGNGSTWVPIPSPTSGNTTAGQFLVDDFGAVGDYRAVSDAGITNGLSVLTSATAAFTAADVGKTVTIAGAGAAGVALVSTIATFTNSTTVSISATASTTVSGAIAEIGTDDTAAVQTTINAANSVKGTVLLGPKSYFCSALNFADKYVTLRGAGFSYQASRLCTFATGDVAWDCTGSRVRMSQVQLGKSDQVTTPKVGLLLAGSATNPGIDFCSFENMFLDGKYTVAGLYVYGVSSCAMYKAAFWNHQAGAGTQMGAFFGSTNPSSIASSFATINTGTVGCSDWTFTGSEFHKFAGAGANNRGVGLSGVSSFRFYGGNISAGATAYIEILAACTNLIFSGVTFQTEGDTVTPSEIFLLSAALTGLVFEQCDTTSTSTILSGAGAFQAGPAVLPFNNGATTLGAVSTQKWIGIGIVTTDLNAGMIAMPYAAIINSMQVVLSSAPGAGLSRTFTLQHNGTSATLTATVTGAATTSAADTTHYVQVAAGAKLLVDSGATGASVPADTHAYISFRALPLT